MIPQEKDRMECLRLAVTITTPKASAAKSENLAAFVVDTAEKFYEFVTKDGKERP